MGYLHIVVVLTVFALTEARTWKVADYPNPRSQNLSAVYQCGRRTSSYICDPDGIISMAQADALDHVLLNFPTDTMCPCSSWSCSKNNSGYIIAIALVRRVHRPDFVEDTEEGREGVVQKFAFDLQRKQWRYGNCDESTVIVYSVEDGILLTLPGATARLRLDSGAVQAIQSELARFFKDERNIAKGLGFLVLNYRHVLDGFPVQPVIYNHVDSGAGLLQLSLVTSLLATIMLKIFC